MEYYLPKNTKINGKILKKIITNSQRKKDLLRFNTLEDYYKNSEAITRKFGDKIITRTGYARYITRLNTGYLLGKPVEYQASKGLDIAPILDKYKSQTITRLDSKIAKDCSIFGRAYELIYSNEDSEVKSAKIDVWNAILVRDSSVEHNKLFGVIYEPIFDENGKKKLDEFDVMILLVDKIEKRKLKDNQLSEPSETLNHFFGEVPLVEYQNNDELSGDFEAVLTDIDAYNILKSDRLGDRRKLADAILAVSGAKLQSKDKEELMNSLVAILPDGAKMEYISKNTDESGTDILRRNINDDIHKISMTPDMADQNFIGNSSGVALAYKILPFMMNSSDKERFFEQGLMERFRIYNTFLSKKKLMKEIKVEDVDVIFKHSLPKNDLETSQIVNNLLGTGLVDKSTLAAQLSFVQNAEEIVELAKKEQSEQEQKVSNGFGKNEDKSV